MKRLMLLTTALIFAGNLAMAAVTANDLVTTYQAQGYTTIEVKTGLTQIKVEAIQGRAKVEVIYDAATGAILKQETSRARAGDAGQGVELSTVARDFLNSNGGGGGNGGNDNGSGNDDGPGHDAGDDHGGGNDNTGGDGNNHDGQNGNSSNKD